MNNDMIPYMLLALAAGLLVGGVPLLIALRRNSELREEFDRLTPAHSSPPDPEDVGLDELALLSSGPGRVGEAVLTDAFLRGRIRPRLDEGLFVLVGSALPPTNEKASAREELVEGFRDHVGVSAYDMVRGVVDGRAVERLRADLIESGLIMDSPRLRRLLERRKNSHVVFCLLCMAFWFSLLPAIGLVYSGPWQISVSLVVPAALLVPAGLLTATLVVMESAGGEAPNTIAPAGRAVVALAQERYAAPATRPTKFAKSPLMTRDHAVRHTAVTGLHELGRGKPRKSGDRLALIQKFSNSHRDPSPASVHTARDGGTKLDSVRLETLCSFADFCQRLSPPGHRPRSGFDPNDGWGRIGSSANGGAGDGGGGGGC